MGIRIKKWFGPRSPSQNLLSAMLNKVSWQEKKFQKTIPQCLPVMHTCMHVPVCLSSGWLCLGDESLDKKASK